MSDKRNDTLWAARLHLKSGTPATLLETRTIRDICALLVEHADAPSTVKEHDWFQKGRELSERRIGDLESQLTQARAAATYWRLKTEGAP